MVLSHAELAFDVGYWCVAFVLLNAAIYIVSPFVFATWKSLDDKKKEKVRSRTTHVHIHFYRCSTTHYESWGALLMCCPSFKRCATPLPCRRI